MKLLEHVEDMVSHPPHYETGKFECIDVMIETQGVQATKDFLRVQCYEVHIPPQA